MDDQAIYWYGIANDDAKNPERSITMGQFIVGVAGLISYERTRYLGPVLWATTPEALTDAKAIDSNQLLAEPCTDTLEREAKDDDKLVPLLSQFTDEEVSEVIVMIYSSLHTYPSRCHLPDALVQYNND
jgi:hypothetical protein